MNYDNVPKNCEKTSKNCYSLLRTCRYGTIRINNIIGRKVVCTLFLTITHFNIHLSEMPEHMGFRAELCTYTRC